MSPHYSTEYKFIIGCMFGFIVRHVEELKLSTSSETKEDYEQSILYYLFDGGMLRMNNICVKTKFNTIGGLGPDRYERNKKAVKYLLQTYPNMVKCKKCKSLFPEIRLVLSI